MNITNSIKRLLKNKNIVTVGGVLIIVVMLYTMYNFQLNQELTMIQVPVATQIISDGKQITEELSRNVMVPQKNLNKEAIITERRQLARYYVKNNHTIVESSFFYKSALNDTDVRRNEIYESMPENKIPYKLSVDSDKLYGNTIQPGTYVDLYLYATDDNSVPIFAKMLSDVKIIAIKDRNGNNAFDSYENRQPSFLIFAADEEIYYLLKKAEYLKSYNTDIVLAPKTGIDNNRKAMSVSSTYLINFINSKTVNVPIDKPSDSAIKSDVKSETSMDGNNEQR